jgi:hypothetical protein
MMEEVMNTRSRLGFAISAAALAVACGGTSSPSEEVAQGNNGVSVQGLSADDCTDLRSTIDKLRAQIQECSPTGSAMQCNIVVDDVCCPISAAGGPLAEFKDAVATYKDKCHYACPAVLCRDPSTAMCGLDGQCHP